MLAEGDDEPGGKTDGRLVIHKQAQPLAELNDESSRNRFGEFDFREVDAFAGNSLAYAVRLIWIEWIVCHPTNLNSLRRSTMRSIY